MAAQTETLDKLYLEWSQFTQAKTAKEIKLASALDEMTDVLEECEAYFDNKADADHDESGVVPNREMVLLSAVKTALAGHPMPVRSNAPDLLGVLIGYMSAVETMNAAMKDGINVQGAVAALIGWEDMAKAAIANATASTPTREGGEAA